MDMRGRWICFQSQFLGYATVVNLNRTKSFLFDLKCTKIAGGWGSTPDPAGRAYSAPPDPLAVTGGGGGEGTLRFCPSNLNFLAMPLVPPCKCASVQWIVGTEMCSCNGDETCFDNVKRDIEEYEKLDTSESDTDDEMIVEQFDLLYRLSLTLKKWL